MTEFANLTAMEAPALTDIDGGLRAAPQLRRLHQLKISR
jgi:hypothetical protein